MTDDSLMDRFDRNSRRFRARDAIVAVLVALFVLVLFQGESMESTGQKMEEGVQKDVVLAVAKPAGWIASQLPLGSAAADVTAPLSPDEELDDSAGFEVNQTQGLSAGRNEVAVVTPQAFSPDVVPPARPVEKKKLGKLLVTGDSLSTPLDLEMARVLAGKAEVVRESKLGTGISKSELVDWGKLSATQTAKHEPDAVAIFIGANEGFDMKGPDGKDVVCCSAEWAAVYANRARAMINTYRQGGKAHVYWITVMTPRDPKRQKISKVVNAAIQVAAQPWRDQVDVIDTVPIFTPGERYRDSMEIDGKDALVRESDGIHLNREGADFLGRTLLERLGRSFAF
jgi:hypothetical protein